MTALLTSVKNLSKEGVQLDKACLYDTHYNSEESCCICNILKASNFPCTTLWNGLKGLGQGTLLLVS